MIEKVIAGNDHAFRILVEKYRNHLFRTVFSVLKDQKEAEDATQEVFIKIYTSLPKYENQGFKTWLTRIAINHAIDVKRKQKRRREDVVEEMELQIESPESNNVELEVIKRERQKLVQSRLKEVPENYRDVIYGFYIEEKSYQEIASEQNVQVKTIETKLYRARLWIKNHWKEEEFL
ncbi:MAG TPA: sigma-70 family RNA polymerase sigma factor [Niallia sp.]|nr:sigma-70 family RNA polymerase sigma factor [Niallia sp.]